MAWTIPKDIKDRWLANKTLPADTQLEVFIGDVERQISNYYTKIQQRITDETLSLDFVKQTVANIVIEFLLTEGQPFQQETQSYANVGSRSVSYSLRASRYSLILTEADYARLAPENVTGMFTVKITPNTPWNNWEENNGSFIL
jgi:hypothetical protein